MNILTKLQIGNNREQIYTREYLITEVHTSFSRTYNAFHPDATPDCFAIDISLVVPERNDLSLQEWYITNEYLSGRILFDLMNLDAKGEMRSERSLYFYDTQCFFLGERYDIQDSSLRIMDLKLRPGHCVIDGVPFGEEHKTED